MSEETTNKGEESTVDQPVKNKLSLTEGLSLTKEDTDFLHEKIKGAVTGDNTVSESMLEVKGAIDAAYTDETKRVSLYLLAGFVIGSFVARLKNPAGMLEMLMSMGARD